MNINTKNKVIFGSVFLGALGVVIAGSTFVHPNPRYTKTFMCKEKYDGVEEKECVVENELRLTARAADDYLEKSFNYPVPAQHAWCYFSNDSFRRTAYCFSSKDNCNARRTLDPASLLTKRFWSDEHCIYYSIDELVKQQ